MSARTGFTPGDVVVCEYGGEIGHAVILATSDDKHCSVADDAAGERILADHLGVPVADLEAEADTWRSVLTHQRDDLEHDWHTDGDGKRWVRVLRTMVCADDFDASWAPGGES